MIRNYCKIAWRHLLRSKLYSSINIIGLAAGMAVAMHIGLWIWDELTFDHYHHNHGRLAEVLSVGTFNGTTTAEPFASVPMAAELRRLFPGDFTDLALTTAAGQTLTAGDKKIGQWGWWVQAGFPRMFTLKMLEGSQDALKDPSSILIAQSLARTLFGDADPLNQTILTENRSAVKVGGVYEDLPANTSLTGAGFLLAWENKDNAGRMATNDWSDHHFQLFVQLKDKAGLARTSAKIKDISKPYLKNGWEELQLHPMDRWRLYDKFENGKMTGGRLQSVWLFGFIGSCVLLLACINFMNLSTARSEKRARETGIRKAIGSLRSQLIGQFLTESLLVAFLASLLALLLAQLSLPMFNGLAGKQLTIPFGVPLFWLTVLGFTCFTGLLAGSYPAFYLSGFQAAKVLKGPFRAGRLASLPRQVLVVLQFTVSIALIVGTIVVYRQVQYAKDRPIGYSPAGLITMELNMPDLQQHYDALRGSLLQTGAVENVSESSSPMTNVRNSMLGYDWAGRDPRSVPIIGTLFVSYEFGKTAGWTIIDGRDFSSNFPADSGAYILNEAAVRFTGMKEPVGKTIRWHQADHPIVGVVKDMVMGSPYMPVEPVFFTLQSNPRIRYVNIRIKSTQTVREALAKIEAVFKKYNPDSPFYYSFTDEAYGSKFLEEEHIGHLTTFFSILAIFISCLGLFGLASFVAEQRTREIGIRKVLGATVVHLWALLSKEFVLLVMLSFLIASPIAWSYLNRWLQGYPYRITISWWVFAASGLGALFITLLTVSIQAIKAALMNPVKSLKTD
jgi:putative ABC transport system permease protein